jgi:protein gp37
VRRLQRVGALIRFLSVEPLLGPIPQLTLKGRHWIIGGGESHLGARPIETRWVGQIRDRRIAQAVPFFFKQWGGGEHEGGGADSGRQDMGPDAKAAVCARGGIAIVELHRYFVVGVERLVE